MAQHPALILAFLEPHHVIRGSPHNELQRAGAARGVGLVEARRLTLVEEPPPVEVVRQHLERQHWARGLMLPRLLVRAAHVPRGAGMGPGTGPGRRTGTRARMGQAARRHRVLRHLDPRRAPRVLDLLRGGAAVEEALPPLLHPRPRHAPPGPPAELAARERARALQGVAPDLADHVVQALLHRAAPRAPMRRPGARRPGARRPPGPRHQPRHGALVRHLLLGGPALQHALVAVLLPRPRLALLLLLAVRATRRRVGDATLDGAPDVLHHVEHVHVRRAAHLRGRRRRRGRLRPRRRHRLACPAGQYPVQQPRHGAPVLHLGLRGAALQEALAAQLHPRPRHALRRLLALGAAHARSGDAMFQRAPHVLDHVLEVVLDRAALPLLLLPHQVHLRRHAVPRGRPAAAAKARARQGGPRERRQHERRGPPATRMRFCRPGCLAALPQLPRLQ
mmetsp:Transcript_115045/g.325893  ORF Transcript_115045/g.325893 Transcript_115045/m.325893 type:complete len:450 (-) Transcript_115045:97-1446(-)